MPDTILISELFGPVLQGEGALNGQVSHFIRTSGCGYRCTWCDTLHAVDPLQIKEKSRHMTIDEIIDQIDGMPKVPWMTLSGGDPVAWDLAELCIKLHFGSYKIAVETQGALWNDWLESADLVTCSPKPPSSGMIDKLSIPMLQKYHARLGARLIFKIVAFDEADLDFVERIHRGFPRVPLYITSGTPQQEQSQLLVAMQVIDRFRTISEAILKRPALYDATVACQQHVLLFGHELGR
jgi:7-carboxy-7-deazaguanine synthase